LCFADLRPPEPQPEPEPEASELVSAGQTGLAEPPAPPRPAPMLTPHPILDGPLGGQEVPGAPATPPVARGGKHALRPEEDVAVMSLADLKAGTPGWPCQTCDTAVPLALTQCPACGSGFMAAAKDSVKVTLPVIGNVAELTTGARVALMIGGATLVTVLFFLLLLLLGSIF
jgi:hypothetical protein